MSQNTKGKGEKNYSITPFRPKVKFRQKPALLPLH
jgi:hypothetical protein